MTHAGLAGQLPLLFLNSSSGVADLELTSDEEEVSSWDDDEEEVEEDEEEEGDSSTTVSTARSR